MAYHGGLQGKARRVHHERRASRLYAHQWIEEYLEPEDRPSRPPRYIPVRSRAEFLPSIAGLTDEPATLSLGAQLELPLVARVDEPRSRIATHSNLCRSSEEVEPRVLRFPTLNKSTAVSEDVRRHQHPDRPGKGSVSSKRTTAVFKPWHAPRPRPFSVKEFLSGCAMGTAAAVVLLATLWAILG